MDSLEPTAVPMPRARELLGDKSYSEIYEAIDEGKLVALKDGRKISSLSSPSAHTWRRCRAGPSEHWPHPGQSGHDGAAHNDQRRRLTQPTIH